MRTNFVKEILKKAIKHYGKSSQKDMLFEEMAELQKEVCKEKRGLGSICSIVEEMADVYIMLEQIKIIYDITDETINKFATAKLNRLNKRIDDEINARNEAYSQLEKNMQFGQCQFDE